jgi:hypothetical protein
MLIVNALLLLLDYGDLISKTFPTAKNPKEWLEDIAFLSGLPWYWKLITLLIANILLIGEGAFRAIRKRERQRDGYARKLQEIEDAKPNLVLLRTEVNPTPWGRNWSAPFVAARFINKPKGNSEKSVARDARARISFFEASTSRPLIQDMDARWSSSTQPSALAPATSWNSLLPMRFGIDDAQNIDIAFRSTSGEFVAFNNDSYHYSGFTKPGHELGMGPIIAEIRLFGVDVNNTFRVKFGTNPNGEVCFLDGE